MRDDSHNLRLSLALFKSHIQLHQKAYGFLIFKVILKLDESWLEYQSRFFPYGKRFTQHIELKHKNSPMLSSAYICMRKQHPNFTIIHECPWKLLVRENLSCDPIAITSFGLGICSYILTKKGVIFILAILTIKIRSK